MKHLCDDAECIYFGQPTQANSCRCHKTSEQMLAAENERLRAALEHIHKRARSEASDDLKELQRQMFHIEHIAKNAL